VWKSAPTIGGEDVTPITCRTSQWSEKDYFLQISTVLCCESVKFWTLGPPYAFIRQYTSQGTYMPEFRYHTICNLPLVFTTQTLPFVKKLMPSSNYVFKFECGESVNGTFLMKITYLVTRTGWDGFAFRAWRKTLIRKLSSHFHYGLFHDFLIHWRTFTNVTMHEAWWFDACWFNWRTRIQNDVSQLGFVLIPTCTAAKFKCLTNSDHQYPV